MFPQFPSVRPSQARPLSLAAMILAGFMSIGSAGAQTMGEIAKQADQPKSAPAKTAPKPAGKAPSMADIAKQADQAATPRPASLPALPTLGEVAKQADAAPAAAATPGCNRPKRPERMPDGRTAAEAEMRAAQAEVKGYVEQSAAFNACVDKLVMDNYTRITAGEYLALMHQQDLTVVLMKSVADRFNEQLRLFKARSQ